MAEPDVIMATRTILLIRHGATKLNNDDVSVDRIRGWKDIPLSKDGREEAHKLGVKLMADKPGYLFCSDLKRAAETAQIISKIIDVPVSKQSKMFRPWDVGDYAGQLSKDAIPQLAYHAEFAPSVSLPNGESFDDFRSRFFSGLQHILAQYPGKVAIVTHHRDERLLTAWEKAGFPDNGDIDIGTFNRKGEHTGAVMTVKIPMSKLNSIGVENAA